MSSTVSVDIDAHVAHVQLDRPQKMNAVSLEMFADLAAAGDRLIADRSVRVVILSGSGENFCAGIDTSIFASDGPGIEGDSMSPQEPSPANLYQRAAYVWREVPVPVICSIHGVAFGAGLQIALGADIRYASADARLSIMEAKWGIIPDMAISTTARNIVPLDRIRELAYTARVIGAPEALRIGLITQMHDDPMVAAISIAEEISLRSPSAVRAMKQLFDEGWSVPAAESLALEARLQSALLGGENQREAVSAAIEKRMPIFVD